MLKQTDSVNIIDNLTQHPTPEGVMLTLMPAGIIPRTLAWFIDFLIRGFILCILFIPMIFFKNFGYALYLILLFVINWLYPVIFEVWREGMTPGKKTCGIYVCHIDGTPITFQSSLIRNLLRTIDFLPFMYVIGVFSIMFNRRSQRIADMVAGTVVVYQEQDNVDKIYHSVYGLMNTPFDNLAQEPSYDMQQDGLNVNQSIEKDYDVNSPLFTYLLKTDEQKSLLSLTDRLAFLPRARQYEITSHLSPLVHSYNQFGRQNSNNESLVYQAVIDKSVAIKGGDTIKKSRLFNKKNKSKIKSESSSIKGAAGMQS